MCIETWLLNKLYKSHTVLVKKDQSFNTSESHVCAANTCTNKMMSIK